MPDEPKLGQILGGTISKCTFMEYLVNCTPIGECTPKVYIHFFPIYRLLVNVHLWCTFTNKCTMYTHK